MKVVILAGGKGTRLAEYTKSIPKPMVPINKKPIILRIMEHYSKYGFKEFVIATGYKNEIIKNYFKNKFLNWKIDIVYTGKDTMTGGRLKRLSKYIKDDTFLLTYGDGLSNVNIRKLINFHRSCKGIATLTAVRPPARFGVIKIKAKKVTTFKEKSSLDEGWINGGFFVMEPEVLKFIKGDMTFLERDPFEKLSKKKKLFAFKYNGFWQCMDTIRDKEILEKYIKNR